MRTNKMVRHNKRHSRKKGGKGGKGSRGRRQFGGRWKSLIDANDNYQYQVVDLIKGVPKLEPIMEKGKPMKGIDIKYMGPGPTEWLIGGDDKTVGELLGGAKERRYIDVIEAIRDMRGGIPATLPDHQKGITLTNAEFCSLFVRLISDRNTKPLALKYPKITDRLDTAGLTVMCISSTSPPISMMTAQRGHSAPASAPPASHYDEPRAINAGLRESYLSEQIKQGMAELGRP